MSYRDFFHESVPTEIDKNPNLLQKGRYGDYPNFRYSFEPNFDYLKVPLDDLERNKRRESFTKLRELIKNAGLIEDKDHPNTIEKKFEGLLIQLGHEEKYIIEHPENIRAATDSEEEKSLNEESENVSHEELEKDAKLIEKMQVQLSQLSSELCSKSDISYTTSFKYEGDDVEKYVNELNSIKPLQASYIKRETDETIVNVIYDMKFKVKYEDAEYIYTKYGEEILSGKEDLEIDEEDEEKLQNLINVDISPQELYSELLTQIVETEMRKEIEKNTNIEPIQIWGQFVNHFTKSREEDMRLNTFYDYRK